MFWPRHRNAITFEYVLRIDYHLKKLVMHCIIASQACIPSSSYKSPCQQLWFSKHQLVNRESCIGQPNKSYLTFHHSFTYMHLTCYDTLPLWFQHLTKPAWELVQAPNTYSIEYNYTQHKSNKKTR